MKMESAAREGAEINGEDMYRMGAYSFKSLKNKQSKKDDANRIQQDKGITCYNWKYHHWTNKKTQTKLSSMKLQMLQM